MNESWRSQTATRLGSAAWHRRVIVELVLLAVAWRLYRYGRFMVRDQRDDAFANASDILAVERATGLDVELGLQRLTTANEVVIELLNRYYVYAHFPLTIGCLVWLLVWDHTVYRGTRRALFAAMGLGLVVHAVYPLAPPRMVSESGMIDALAEYGPQVYSTDHFASISNQFAAMPSFHAGWAVLVAWLVISHATHRLRWVIVVHPVLMVWAVMATANHYLLDAVAGAAIVLGACKGEEWLRKRRDQRSPGGLIGPGWARPATNGAVHPRVLTDGGATSSGSIVSSSPTAGPAAGAATSPSLLEDGPRSANPLTAEPEGRESVHAAR